MNSLAVYQLVVLSDATAHQVPTLPFTIDQAHEVMRVHVACRARLCARKAAARQVLIDSGRMVPDTSKPQ
ncbi:hypothetical protein OHA40_06230 [Nocardia sp. NBC_00508]|uniref:hypothetical protein n=1 Tax=Nocardia sp. NBC_00508 TaxID=2975992 RepID=UPI002E816AF8|nr:hypothetical protein [Nocardia sp. NBC_00508]WUD67723.1 hypothetical protein OHA40_06230 [Nocardia sp. NBC_00508]